MLSSHLATSIILHYRQLFSINFPLPSELSQKTWEISQKTWELSQKNVGLFPKNVGDFPKNVGHFPKNVGVFFHPPPREYFSQQIETQIKQEMEELQA